MRRYLFTILFILTALLIVGHSQQSPPCSTNQVLVWNATASNWQCSTISAVTTTKLGSDVTNNNAVANTIADVTGLLFPVVSGRTYRFSFYIVYTSAATTTGARWSINGPTNTFLNYTSRYTLTATTQTLNFGMGAYNLPAASNATALTTGNTAIIEGVVTPSADGNVIARFASEVSSSAVVAKAGSYVVYSEY